MNLLTTLRECQTLLRWHFFRMLSKTSPSSVQLKCWMNTPLLPLGMGHSLTATNYPTTISSSMHVLGMMPPTHQPIRREEMYMLLLAPRISPLLRNTTNHSSLKTQKPHQMTFIKYIKPNIKKGLQNHYLGSRGIVPKYDGPLYVPAEVYKHLFLEAVVTLKKYNTEAINIFAKKWDIHVTDIADQEPLPSEDTTPEEQHNPHQFEDAPDNESDPFLDFINSQHHQKEDMNNALQA